MRAFTVDRSLRLAPGDRLDYVRPDAHGAYTVGDHGAIPHSSLVGLLDEFFPRGITRHGARYLIAGTNDRLVQAALGRGWPIALAEADAERDARTEAFMEAVRRLHNPKAPSRFASIFGSPTIEDAIRFRQEYGGGVGRIYEVEADEGFIADMHLVRGAGHFLAGMDAARRYWDGKMGPNPLPEVLLSPPVVLGDVVQ